MLSTWCRHHCPRSRKLSIMATQGWDPYLQPCYSSSLPMWYECTPFEVFLCSKWVLRNADFSLKSYQMLQTESIWPILLGWICTLSHTQPPADITSFLIGDSKSVMAFLKAPSLSNCPASYRQPVCLFVWLPWRPKYFFLTWLQLALMSAAQTEVYIL